MPDEKITRMVNPIPTTLDRNGEPFSKGGVLGRPLNWPAPPRDVVENIVKPASTPAPPPPAPDKKE